MKWFRLADFAPVWSACAQLGDNRRAVVASVSGTLHCIRKRQKRQAHSKSFANIEACPNLAPASWSAAVPSAAVAFACAFVYTARTETLSPLRKRQKRQAHSKSFANIEACANRAPASWTVPSAAFYFRI